MAAAGGQDAAYRVSKWRTDPLPAHTHAHAHSHASRSSAITTNTTPTPPPSLRERRTVHAVGMAAAPEGGRGAVGAVMHSRGHVQLHLCSGNGRDTTQPAPTIPRTPTGGSSPPAGAAGATPCPRLAARRAASAGTWCARPRGPPRSHLRRHGSASGAVHRTAARARPRTHGQAEVCGTPTTAQPSTLAHRLAWFVCNRSRRALHFCAGLSASQQWVPVPTCTSVRAGYAYCTLGVETENDLNRRGKKKRAAASTPTTRRRRSTRAAPVAARPWRPPRRLPQPARSRPAAPSAPRAARSLF